MVIKPPTCNQALNILVTSFSLSPLHLLSVFTWKNYDLTFSADITVFDILQCFVPIYTTIDFYQDLYYSQNKIY